MNPCPSTPFSAGATGRAQAVLVAALVAVALVLAFVAAAVFGPANGGTTVTHERLLAVRRAAHAALAERLNRQPQAVQEALTLDLRLPDAAVAARPLGPDEGGDPWSEITVSMLDAEGRVVHQQSERVAFYRPDGTWTVSRILIDGLED